MELINSQILKDIVDKDKLNATGLLPELVKRLILSSVSKISQIRFPSGDDIWAPGFDGVVECDECTSHIKSGYSVWECGTNHLWQNIDEYYFTSIFEKIDNYIYSDEIAEVEFEFYRKHLIKDYTEGMKTYLFLHPFEIVNVFNNDTAEGFGIELWFSYHFSLPKMAYSDIDKFLFFFDTIIEKSQNRNQALSFTGQVLGRTINGSDKIFPHEFARHVIEKYKDDKLGNGFIVGKMNSIGIRSVGDGSDQISIAQKYNQDANAIRIIYPCTANLLDKLSSNHKHDAEEDKIDSEIYFY